MLILKYVFGLKICFYFSTKIKQFLSLVEQVVSIWVSLEGLLKLALKLQ